MAGPAPEEKPKDRGLYPIFIKSDELHAKLGGGLPKGAVMLIEGVEGSGRSVISQRLCYGLLANGASVTFVSTEMTIKDFIDQMYSIEYKVGPHLLSQKLLYLPVYPLLGQTMVRDDFLDKLIGSPQLYERDVLIVDSFSSLINRRLDNNQAQSLMGFLKKVARSNKTVILTAEAGIASLDELVISPSQRTLCPCVPESICPKTGDKSPHSGKGYELCPRTVHVFLDCSAMPRHV